MLHQTVNAVVEIVKENYLASVNIIVTSTHMVKLVDTLIYCTELIVFEAGCIYSRE